VETLKMDMEMTVSEILNSAKSLENKKLDELFSALFALRLQRNGTTVLSDLETNLLRNINTEFNPTSLDRLKYLDWKMEFGALTSSEESELLQLAEAFENYSVERLKHLSQLAMLRQVSIDQLIAQLGLNV
jgi:hypothetical protein